MRFHGWTYGWSLGVLGCLAPILAAEPSATELKRWLAELNHDSYAMRERAGEQLLSAGEASIAPLEKELPTANLEVTVRGLQVLAGLASKAETVSTRDAAFDALSRLALTGPEPVAENARMVLGGLRATRQREAIAWFQERGAAIDLSQRTAQFGAAWSGEERDLSRLAYLYEIQELQLTGETINDAWLQAAARMPELRQLVLKKTKTTTAGLRAISVKNQLLSLQILYVKLDAQAGPLLAGMNHLTELRLYGTGIDALTAEQLTMRLTTTRLDIRRGGFLGIGVQAIGEGAIVSNVQPGSAAARAGIQLGDILRKFNGEAINNFEQLQAAIGRSPPGEAVEIEIVRDEKLEKLKVTLGEWE